MKTTMFKIKYLLILTLVFAFSLAIPTSNVYAKSKATIKVTVDKTQLNVSDKDNKTAQLTVTYNNKNVTKKAKYSTSNKKIVTVNKKGKITAKKKGKVTIKVKYKGKTKKIKITVIKKSVNSAGNTSGISNTNSSIKKQHTMISFNPNASDNYKNILSDWSRAGDEVSEKRSISNNGTADYYYVTNETKRLVIYDNDGKVCSYDDFEAPADEYMNPHMNEQYRKIRNFWFLKGYHTYEGMTEDDMLGFTIYFIYNIDTDQTLRMDGKIYPGAFTFEASNIGDPNFY